MLPSLPSADTMQWWQPNIAGRRPQARKTHATARVDNRVFVFGGHDGGSWLHDMHLLDLSTAEHAPTTHVLPATCVLVFVYLPPPVLPAYSLHTPTLPTSINSGCATHHIP